LLLCEFDKDYSSMRKWTLHFEIIKAERTVIKEEESEGNKG